MKEQAVSNRQKIAEIKTALDFGQISYDEAQLKAQPIIDAINDKAREIAKKYGMKPQLVSFKAMMR